MHVLLQGPLVPLHLKKFLSFKKHQIQDKEQVVRCTVSVLFNMRWSNKGNQILLGLSTLKELGGGGVWALNRPSASFTCRTYIWKDWIIEYGQKHNRGFFQSQGENFSYVVIRTPLRERFQSRTHLSHNMWSKWSKFSAFGLLFLIILSRKILRVYRLFVLPGGDLYFKEANQLPKHWIIAKNYTYPTQECNIEMFHYVISQS